jgi:hypothetical protein
VAGPFDAQLTLPGKPDVFNVIIHNLINLSKIDAIILPDEFTVSNTRWLAGGNSFAGSKFPLDIGEDLPASALHSTFQFSFLKAMPAGPPAS